MLQTRVFRLSLEVWFQKVQVLTLVMFHLESECCCFCFVCVRALLYSQSSGLYRHMKHGVLYHHDSSACCLWTPVPCLEYRRGSEGWEAHSESSVGCHPACLSARPCLHFVLPLRSAASVPVFSSCSDLQLLPVLFTSLDWGL